MKKFTLSLFFFALILTLCIPTFGAVPKLGDLNNDGHVDLADAVLTLQAMSRVDISGQNVSLDNADFNIDGKIALEEAIFTLQAVAGLRDITVPVREASGNVVLPSGFGLPITSLQVYGELGSGTVGEDGGFAVPLSGSGDALAVVTNDSGTLTGSGGTDHFEQAGNQATYTAGQNTGTDTISVKVERISGGERFLMAEAGSTVTVARYTVSIPSTLEVNWYSQPTITPIVTPTKPAGAYFKWTNTGAKGTLTDNTAGHVDNFETMNASVYYRAKSAVPDGVDTIRAELYTSDGILQGSAETVITVSGPVDVPISIVSGHIKYEEEDPAYTAAIYFGVYGTVMMTCVPPAQCSGVPEVEINTHGVDDHDLVTNYPPKLLSHYEGWQTVDWGGGMTNRCLPEETSPVLQLHCQLAPTGVLANWLTAWGRRFGYPMREPSWREQTMRARDDYIAVVLPTLSVYSSWSYKATCWKKQKFN